MNNISQRAQDLSFLSEFRGNRNLQYRTAFWLKSDFEENIWFCQFGDTNNLTLSFNGIKLEDGSLLTDKKNGILLDLFKSWLCLQTNVDVTGGQLLGPSTSYNTILRTARLIDYFLINSDKFMLSKFGLEAATEADFKCMLTDLASSCEAVDSIYHWKDKLTIFLKNESVLLGREEFEAIVKSQPGIPEINCDPADRVLALSNEELVKARAYLWSKGFYKQAGKTFNFRFAPNSKSLANIIYPNTLLGKSSKPTYEELCVAPIERFIREYPAVYVRTNEDNPQLLDKVLSLYQRSIRNLGLLRQIGLPVPLSAINNFSQNILLQELNLKPAGRFATLPQSVVFPSFRNAIEFVLEFGDDLIDSYLCIVRAASAQSINCQIYAAKNDITPLLKPNIRAMGVRRWHLSHFMSMSEDNPGLSTSRRPASSEYFRRFRANEGLFELIRVLYGAVQVCIGTLMARRQGEMIDLMSGQALDRTNRYLVFYKRKSGAIGKREKDAKPLPKIAVRMIKMLERLQRELIKHGTLAEFTSLFARPDRAGSISVKTRLSPQTFNVAFDAFCDYFQTSLNSDGQRYYIREHPLRRFFVILFFWGKSFGGLETLRWFLGHSDLEHLYRYLTESTPGEVLRSVKAFYAVEKIKEQTEGSAALADLLEIHFGTRRFSVLESSELEEYIVYLLQEGKVQIEPEFFKTAEGKSYRILIIVRSN